MSLQVWLPLNGNLNNQGLSDITITNNGTTVDDNGKIGKCYAFNESKYISTNYIGETLNTFSIFMWIKKDSQTGNGTLFRTTTKYSPIIDFNDTNGGLRIFYWYNSSQYFMMTYPALEANIWYHVGITYDGITFCFYINGEMVRSMTVSSAPYITGTFNIGKADGANFFKGKMNDFRIYDHCLSIKEVKEISKGLILHYKLEGFGRENLIKGNFSCISTNSSYSSTGNVETTLTAEDILANKGKTLCLSFDVESTGASTSSVTTYQKDRFGIHGNIKYTISGGTSTQGYPLILFSLGMSGRRYVTWTIPSNLVSIENNLVFSIQTNPSNGFAKPANGNNTTWYIKNVKLEWGSVPTLWCPNSADTLYATLGYNDGIEYDCSGYGNNGTNNSIVVYSNSPKYSCCYQFQKGTGYCYFDNLFLNGLSNNYTFSWWYYSDVPINNTIMWGSAILGNTGYNSDKTFQIFWGLYSSTLSFGSNSYENITLPSGSGQISPPPEKIWHHYALVGGDTVKLYVDGQLYGIVNKKVPLPDIKAIILNGHNTTDTHFQLDCKMSDFRLYSTNLSDSDILELYQTAANIDNNGNLYCYELKEE